MLERRSALASAKPYVSAVLKISERPGFTLTQVAGLSPDFEARLAAVVGMPPEKVQQAQVNGAHTLFRIGPAQFWIVGPETDDAPSRLEGQCAVTPLSSSRGPRCALECDNRSLAARCRFLASWASSSAWPGRSK